MAIGLNGSRHIDFELLVAAFDRVVNDGIPEVFVVEAPTGWGKTKFVQTFYERLALSQVGNAYWPPQLLVGEDKDDWQSSRKRIFPADFQIPDGSELPWLWWGVSCNKRQDGRPAQVLFEDGSQLAAHAGALLETISLSNSAGRSFDGMNAIVGLLAITSVSLASPLVAVLGITGFVRTAYQNRDLIENVKRKRQEREKDLLSLASLREDEVQGMLTNLETIARELPVIIIVDDAQWADPTMIKFLEGISKIEQGKILVIVTTWPATDIVDTDFFVWLTERTNNPRVVRRALQRLTNEELIALAQEEISKISVGTKIDLDAEAAVALLDRAGSTPLGVRALLGLPKIREMIRSGKGLSKNDVLSVPSGLTTILQVYWEALPDDVRYILSLAAVCGRRFEAISMQEVLIAVHPSFLQTFSEVCAQSNFLRHVGDGVYEFVDHVWWDTAKKSAEEVIANEVLAVLYTAIARRARELSGASARFQCTTAWAAHVHLAQEGLVPLDDASVSARRLAEDAYYNGSKSDSAVHFLYALKLCTRDEERLALLGYYLYLFPKNQSLAESLPVHLDFLHQAMSQMSIIGNERDASPELVRFVGQLLQKQMSDAQRPLDVASRDVRSFIKVIKELLEFLEDDEYGAIELLISLASLVREVEGNASAMALIDHFSIQRPPSSKSLIVHWLENSANLHQLEDSLKYFSSRIAEDFALIRSHESLELLDLLSRFWLDVPGEIQVLARNFLNQQLHDLARVDYVPHIPEGTFLDSPEYEIPLLVGIASRIGISEDFVTGILKNVFSLLISENLFWENPQAAWDGTTEVRGLDPEGESRFEEEGQSPEVAEIDESIKNRFLFNLAQSCVEAGYGSAVRDIKRRCLQIRESRVISDTQWWNEAHYLSRDAQWWKEKRRLSLNLASAPELHDGSWCEEWKSLTEATLLPVAPSGLSVSDVQRIWLEEELEISELRLSLESSVGPELDYFDSAYFALKHTTLSFRNFLYICGIRWHDGSKLEPFSGT